MLDKHRDRKDVERDERTEQELESLQENMDKYQMGGMSCPTNPSKSSTTKHPIDRSFSTNTKIITYINTSPRNLSVKILKEDFP